jgi:hypothetical protein
MTISDENNRSVPSIVEPAVELHYGEGLANSLWSQNQMPGATGVVIHEYRAALRTILGFPPPPAGSVLTQIPDNGGVRHCWLEKDGLFVEVIASNRELMLAAADALQPITP